MKNGWYGKYGGSFVPETLVQPLKELIDSYKIFIKNNDYQIKLRTLLRNYAGRPTPVTFAENLTRKLGGARIYLKREDLAHTGAHKINNTLGQALLAQSMGKTRIIAETGAGQHGVAAATAAALLGLECTVYMGKIDMARQAPNVQRMKLLGAEIIPVASGTQTLKDAISQAMRDWIANIRDTHYLLGSVLGPHPYPMMVRDFQSVIGKEARRQFIRQTGKLPDELVACVGGGSNAIGLFYAFLKDSRVRMTGVEAGGKGVRSPFHAARFVSGRPGVLHGTLSYVLQSPEGQILNTHSAAAGLDYAAVGPEHAFLRDSGRARYTHATDRKALEAFHLLSETEGIIPALESAHALAYAIQTAPRKPSRYAMLVNLSGRGDKDLEGLAK